MSLRMVGFDTLQQREMANHHDQHKAVTLEYCQIQKSHYGDKMEVLLTVNISPKRHLED